jgi:hypothetical protein
MQCTLAGAQEATMRIRYLVLVAALIVLAPRLAAAQTTITVTNQQASAYVFNGNVSSPNATLTLTRGQTYIFNVVPTGHPFHITTAPGEPPQDVSTTDFPGLTGQGAQGSTLTFPVPLTGGSSSLFYQCGLHTAMTGSINLVAPTAVPATNRWALVGLGALVLLAGGLAIRRRLSLR